MKRRPYHRFQRKPSGVMGVAIGLLGLIVILVAGYYILNVAHLMMVRTDLQSACDASALAGASSLYDTPEDVENAVLSLAADNYADGLPVSSSSPGTHVKLTAYPGDTIYPGSVKVTATRDVDLI